MEINKYSTPGRPGRPKLETSYLDIPTYRPNVLLNKLMGMYGITLDAELASAIRVHPTYIYKVRTREIPMGKKALVNIEAFSGISIEELLRLMGVEK